VGLNFSCTLILLKLLILVPLWFGVMSYHYIIAIIITGNITITGFIKIFIISTTLANTPIIAIFIIKAFTSF
jgi:hypothetical protein